MRWILIISTLIFAIPIALYALMFRKLHIAC
jgi:chitin synthase